MQIVVWEDKHSTTYYDASTLEAWDWSSIEILKLLTDETYGYWQVYEPYVSDDDKKLAETNIDGLPEDVLALIGDKVKKARKRIAREQQRYQDDLEKIEEAKKFIAAGKSPTLVRKINNQKLPAAWRLIQDYGGGEYEKITLEDVETPRTKENEDD